MPARATPAARAAARAITLSVDVVLLTPRDGRLSVLLAEEPRGREKWALPWDGLRAGEELPDAALRIARRALGAPPALLEQTVTLGDARKHPGGAAVSVAFLGLVHAETAGDAPGWTPVAGVPALARRQAQLLEESLDALQRRIDHAPLAFRLLPPTFTLTELQAVYEVLLGRALHKASFRRALQAAFLVEPTDEWRSEGRGRPAQLFRYAPRRRRGARRGVRFDLLAE
ncbi:MAG: family hydrolase [Gemmatimonadetes bacterium]|nr:family hydrolase [Gemmatimonadota bacterium]